MTKAVIFTTDVAAKELSDAIDVELGYPKQGTDIGGGDHAPAGQSATIHHSYVVSHPTLSQCAYFMDDAAESKRSTASGRIGKSIPISVDLDSTWKDAKPK